MAAPVPSFPSTLTVIMAMCCALSATTCYNLGPAVQKEALNRFPPLTSYPLSRQVRTVFADRRWRTGFVLGVMGILPNLAAVSMVGMAASQPLMGFGLVVLAWYGRRRLGEPLSPRALAGIALMVTLPMLIAFSGVSAPTRTILQPDTRRTLAVAVSTVFAVCACLTVASRRAGILMAPAAGILLSMTAFCLQVISQLFVSTGYHLLRDFPVIAARLFRDSAFLSILGVTIAGFTISAVAYYLQQIGLQRNRATRFNPILNSVSISVGVTLGIVVFGQKLGRPGLYLSAMAVALAGITLSSSPGKTPVNRP
jgi:hypothetical protein